MGKLMFTFTYLNKGNQVIRKGYNLTYSTENGIYNLTFIYDKNETIPSSHGTYNSETGIINITNIVPPNYTGNYTKAN